MMKQTNHTWKHAGAALGAVLLGATAVAAACDDKAVGIALCADTAVSVSADAEARVVLASADGRTTNKATAVMTDDQGNRVHVVSDDDGMVIEFNGKVLAEYGAGEDFGRYEVRGDGGALVATVWADASGKPVISTGPGYSEQPDAYGRFPGTFAWRTQIERPKPRVMLGVSMRPVDAGVARELGVDRETSTRIVNVIEGLPAAHAGVQINDIVLTANGGPGDQKSIGGLLREMEPGDTLRLDVLRDGLELELTVELEQYNPAALVTRPQQMIMELWDRADAAKLRRETTELAQEMAVLAEKMNAASGAERAEIGRRMAELGRTLAERSAELVRRGTASVTLEADEAFMVPRGSGRGGTIVVPDAPPAPSLGFGTSEQQAARMAQLAELLRRQQDDQAELLAKRETELQLLIERLQEHGGAGDQLRDGVDARMDEIDRRLERMESLIQMLVERDRRQIEEQEQERSRNH